MAAKLLFSEDQIKGIREEFSKFDTNGNGTISYKVLPEAFIAVARNWESGPNEILMKYISDREDETIEFSEFLTMVADQTTSNTRLRQYYKAFVAADKNGDRVLSYTELREALSTTDPPMTKEDIDALIDKTDLNEDGKVDLSEFVRVIMASFK